MKTQVPFSEGDTEPQSPLGPLMWTLLTSAGHMRSWRISGFMENVPVILASVCGVTEIHSSLHPHFISLF